MLRYKPHTLSDDEEKLLAMQSEMAGTANQVFRQLNNADLKCGSVKNERGETGRAEPRLVLGASCTRPTRGVREAAFHQYYQQFTAHENTLAATLWPARSSATSITPRPASYPARSSRALFPDNVPLSVYDNLIASVHRNLPALHRYYDLRRRKMKLKRHPSLRHLRADPQRAGNAAHLGPGRQGGDRAPRAAGQRILRRARKRARRAAGAIATPTRASRAARSARARSTASRTS